MPVEAGWTKIQILSCTTLSKPINCPQETHTDLCPLQHPISSLITKRWSRGHQSPHTPSNSIQSSVAMLLVRVMWCQPQLPVLGWRVAYRTAYNAMWPAVAVNIYLALSLFIYLHVHFSAFIKIPIETGRMTECCWGWGKKIHIWTLFWKMCCQNAVFI